MVALLHADASAAADIGRDVDVVYPIVVSTMLLNHIWYGYAVIIPGALFVVITLMLL